MLFHRSLSQHEIEKDRRKEERRERALQKLIKVGLSQEEAETIDFYCTLRNTGSATIPGARAALQYLSKNPSKKEVLLTLLVIKGALDSDPVGNFRDFRISAYTEKNAEILDALRSFGINVPDLGTNKTRAFLKGMGLVLVMRGLPK